MSHSLTQQLIQGPVGLLEITTHLPQADIKSSAAVVCHPHPLYGGTMNNKVVTTLAKIFETQGVTAVRFNFRGVGKSEGEYAKGIGEAGDLRAVINFAKKTFSKENLFLAGFSFGSYVAARMAIEENIRQLILIAPPVNHFDFKSLPEFSCPWIVVQGEQDEIVPSNEVFEWIATRQRAPQIISFKNSSHFFHGHLIFLQDALKKAIVFE